MRHFIEKLSPPGIRAGGPASIVVSQDAMRRLMAHSWPGNIRQLENAVERALALLGNRTTIEVTDLPPEIQSAQVPLVPAVDFPEEGIDMPGLIGQIERDLIQRALLRSRGNKAAAAGLLGLKRTTLVEKLKRI
jgi:DNA-binding NtrC family response regulator